MIDIIAKCVSSSDNSLFCSGMNYDAKLYKNGRMKVFNSKGLVSFTDQHGAIGCKVVNEHGQECVGYIFFEEVKL